MKPFELLEFFLFDDYTFDKQYVQGFFTGLRMQLINGSVEKPTEEYLEAYHLAEFLNDLYDAYDELEKRNA